MKREQTVYKCNECGTEQIIEHGSFGGRSPCNIEVKYPTPAMMGYNMTTLDFCCLMCLKKFVDKKMKEEN